MGGGGGGPEARGGYAPSGGGAGGATARALATSPEESLARFGRFEDVVALIRESRDVQLLIAVETGVRLASYAPGRIEFTPAEGAPAGLAANLSQRLQGWTGARWGVSVVNGCEAPTIAEENDAAALALEASAKEHPLMQAVIAAFPKAKIEAIRSYEEMEAEAAVEALQEVEGEWDPFEEG